MSFLSRLFGGGKPAGVDAAAPKPTATVEQDGFTIRAEPYRNERGQYQTAGTITREIDGTTHEHRFVRADQFPTVEDATAMSLAKGRQIVAERGGTLFAKPPG
jgi:hypothetical protein